MLESKCFVDPLSAPFSRRGSDMAFANANNGDSQYGKNTLYLMTCRGGVNAAAFGSQNGCRQVALELLAGGQKLPTVISTTEAEGKRR